MVSFCQDTEYMGRNRFKEKRCFTVGEFEFAVPVQHLNEISGRLLALETWHLKRLGSFQ